MNAIVTGATKGIGFAISEQLLSEGYNLAICSRNERELEQVIEKWQNDYPSLEILGIVCDVSIKDQVEDFASKVLSKFIEIDVLVNNAGVFFPGELLEEKEGVLDQMIQTNLMSAYHLTRRVGPVMKERGKGHIFNMCSIASQIAYPNGGSYSISKFALLGFSKVLREELKGHGVKVTSILPGATWSNSWSGVDLPESRLMKSEDIAIVVSQALKMSPSAVIEEIVIRPQLGDL